MQIICEILNEIWGGIRDRFNISKAWQLHHVPALPIRQHFPCRQANVCMRSAAQGRPRTPRAGPAAPRPECISPMKNGEKHEARSLPFRKLKSLPLSKDGYRFIRKSGDQDSRVFTPLFPTSN